MDDGVDETGFSVVYEPKDQKHVVDIVIVHGLLGHPYQTWACSPSKPSRPHGSTLGKAGERSSKSRKTISNLFRLRKRSLELDSPVRSITNQLQESLAAIPAKLFWPADLLPSECPLARILVWGYETREATEPGHSMKQISLFSHARILLNELAEKRDPGTPLIFIVYSLGGIVVKDMLCRAESSGDATLVNIVQSTRSLVFLGTPHFGSSDLTSVADICSRVVSTVGIAPDPIFLDTLGLRDSDLRRCHDAFIAIWETYAFQVRTFQESAPVTGLNTLKVDDKVVPDDSSRLSNHKELVEMLDANHLTLCKFDSCNSTNWRKFGVELRSLYNAAKSRNYSNHSDHFEALQNERHTLAGKYETSPPAARQYRNILATDQAHQHSGDVHNINTYNIYKDSSSHDVQATESFTAARTTLKFPEMEYRQRTTDYPAINTCRWLFSNPKYCSWLERKNMDETNGLLWIKGKPGSGKSILLNEAVRRASNINVAQSRQVASFFFNAQGEPLEKTQLGLFRTLLYQLLPLFPEELEDFQVVYMQKLTGASSAVHWELKELSVRLQRIFSKPRDVDITLFVDAIDECIDHPRRLVEYFRDLTTLAYNSGAKLSVCISSRPYPTMTINNCPVIVVEDFNFEDISTYVSEKLSQRLRSNVSRMLGRGSLEQDVIDRANGVFLWAVLVVDIIRRERDMGAHNSHLRNLIRDNRLVELEGIYSHILEKLPGTELEQSLHLFQWALFAARPLRRNEWSHVLAMITKPSIASLNEWEDSLEHDGGDDPIPKLIRKLSCGLIEMRPHRTDPIDSKSNIASSLVSLSDVANSLQGYAGSYDGESTRVELIHESVREFFISGRGFFLLNQASFRDATGSGHIHILECCTKYIMLQDLDILVDARIQAESLDDSESGSWMVEVPDRRVADYKTANISEQSVLPLQRSLSRASFGSSASHYSKSSHHDSGTKQRKSSPARVRRARTKSSSQRDTKVVPKLQNLASNVFKSVTHEQESKATSADVMSWLNPIESSTPEGPGLSSRLYSKVKNATKRSSVLPQTEAEIPATSITGRKSANLSRVATPSSVNTLSSRSARTEPSSSVSVQQLEPFPELLGYVTDMFTFHAISADKCAADPEQIIGQLTTADAWERWCLLKEEMSRAATLILFAVDHGLQSWISHLLRMKLDGKRRANVNESDGHLDLALIASIRATDVDTMVMLLDAGANPRFADRRSRTSLHHIAAVSNLQMLEIFAKRLKAMVGSHYALNEEVEFSHALNERDIFEQTPLHHAVKQGTLEMVMSLIAYGADVTYADWDRNTPLHLACQRDVSNGSDIVETLVRNGANVNDRNLSGNTPLHVVCSRGTFDKDVCTTLLSVEDVRINRRNHVAQTARDCAIIRAHREAVSLIDYYLEQHALAPDDDSVYESKFITNLNSVSVE